MRSQWSWSEGSMVNSRTRLPSGPAPGTRSTPCRCPPASAIAAVSFPSGSCRASSSTRIVTLYWALTAIAAIESDSAPGLTGATPGGLLPLSLQGMKELTKLSIAVACVASCAGLGAPAALADEASFLYDPGTVNAIEMTLPQAGIEGLESEPFQYQPGGTVVVTPTDGTPAGRGTPSKTFQNVEIKLKGKPQGSFEDHDHKAAF